MPNTDQWNSQQWNAGASVASGGTTLVADLLYAALRIAGVTQAPGRTPSTDQFNVAFLALNRMTASWNTQRDIIYAVKIGQYQTIPNQQLYTIGVDPSGQLTPTWADSRPQRILRAAFLLNTGQSVVSLPLRLLTAIEWADKEVKAVTTSVPTELYCDYAYPLANIYLWPVPTVTAPIELHTWLALGAFVSSGDQVLLPPGYEEAIQYGLAVRLSHWFHTEISEDVVRQASRALAAIKAKNSPSIAIASTDIGTQANSGDFNYYTGTKP